MRAKHLLWLTLALASAVHGQQKPRPGEEPPEVRFAAMRAAEYAPLGKTAEEILRHENTRDAITLVGALAFRIEAKPVETRSAVERKLLATYQMQSEVNNGGFDQYFSNATGDDAALALQGFKDLGATKAAQLVQKAMAAFPGAKPPVDREQRQKVMERIRARATATWNSCDQGFYLLDDFADRALAFAKKNRAQIVL